MKKTLLLIFSALLLVFQAQGYESLYLCAWDYENEESNKIELTTTDGDMEMDLEGTILTASNPYLIISPYELEEDENWD